MRAFITRRILGLDDFLAQQQLNPALVTVWPEALPPTREAMIEQAQGCMGLLTMVTDRIDAALLDALPTLKVISQCAVGVNNIDLAAARARGVVVGNTPGVLTDATADMAFALLLSAARHIVAGAAYVKADQWRTWDPLLLLGQQVGGATLAVIGYGRIGQAMARRGKGFGMRVLAVSPSLTAAQAEADGVECVTLEAALQAADYVSLHTPLTAQTRHLIGATQLAQMKPTAMLINTARGEVVDPQALYAALRDGRPAMAALDVTSPEPIAADDPLLTLPNCLIVPHLGSATVQARREMTRLAVANLAAGLRGEALLHQV